MEDVEEIIARCEDHQHHNQREADAKADLLRIIRQRPAAHDLDRVEQKMTAIQQRYRKEVEEADRDRDRGCQVEEPDQGNTDAAIVQSHLPDLTRDLGNPYRSAQLVRAAIAANEPSDEGK